jgi:DNA-binding XRE family transcriptional regulator
MSPDQCREARELLRWTRQELAGAAGVAPWAVDAFEEGREVLTGYKAAIRTALEAVGIGFPFEIADRRARQVGVTYSPPDRSEGH